MISASRTDSGPATLIGMGANLGDPLGQLASAVASLGALGQVLRLSAVYRSAPVGYRDQPDFLNMVVLLRTTLEPRPLLGALQRIEQEAGRRRVIRNGPRSLDLDLLDQGDLVVAETDLELPHPRLHERRFVLVPLLEICPEWRHPRTGRSARALLEAAPDALVERLGLIDELLGARARGSSGSPPAEPEPTERDG